MSYDTQNFEHDVIEQSRRIPVLVDFWAEWCGPCRILGPVLERLAEHNRDQWRLVKLNTESYPQIAAQYGIQSIPNVKLFIEGKVVDEFVGALPETAIVEWLKKAIPSPQQARIDNAINLVQNGSPSEGRILLEESLAAEPDNEQAAAWLARTIVYEDPGRAVKLVEPIDAASPFTAIAESVREFAEIFRIAGGESELPAGPARETYEAAVRSLKVQEYEAAIEQFVTVIRMDRQYNDDGARKACIAIFKHLGEDHPLTRRFRPVFSSALYA